LADNVTLNAGSGGAVLATDDVSGVHYQLIKVAFGPLDSATVVSTSNGFPVDLRTNNLSGNLNVNVAASAVTQAVSGTITANAGTGTFTVEQTASLVDDAAFSPASSKVIPIGFTFDDVTPDTVNEGDIGAARMSANRNIYVQLRDAAGNERGLNVDAAGAIGVTDAGGTLTIDNGTLAVVGGGTEGTALRVTIATDSTGVLSIDDNGASITVDGTVTANAGTGTFTTSDTATLVDDAAFTPATSRVLMVGAEFDNVAVDSVDEGDAGALRMSANRNLLVNIRDAAGNERGLNVDAAGAIGVTHGTLSVVGGGTEATALRVTVASDSTGVLSIDDNGASITVDGTVAVSSLPASTNTLEVVGDVAHDAAAAGNPILLGAYASAAAPTDVSADADAVRLWALRNGAQVINVAAGGTLITGDGTNGLDVDVTRVSGTVTVAGAVTNTVLSVVGGGTEAAAQRVTIANDSTGVLSIDDNGASITVDGTVTANAGTGTFTVGGTVTANAGTGTFTTSDTATQIDDAAFTPATSRIMMIGAEFDDVTPDSVNEGDGGALRMSGNRNLFTTLRDAAGNERGVNVDATNRLSVSVDNTATVTIGSLPNEGQQTMANSISVAVASDQTNMPVSQATASALNAQVVGTVAHDGADSGNPVKVGGVARTTNPTAVAAGDRVDLFADDLGRSVVYPIAPRDGIVVGSRISLTSTTETTLVAATASTFHDLVMLILSNESATEVRVDFRDTTAGTVLFSIDLAGDGGGAVVPFRVPWPQATVNTNWTAQCSAAVSTVYVSALCVNNN
jgi:hypothetical protein